MTVPTWAVKAAEVVIVGDDKVYCYGKDENGCRYGWLSVDELAAIIAKHAEPVIKQAKFNAAEAGTKTGMLTCQSNHLGTFEQVRELVEAARLAVSADYVTPDGTPHYSSWDARLRCALEPFSTTVANDKSGVK